MEIITDRPSHSKLYDSIIAILNEITGLKWGFVRSRRRIRYVTSKELPAKIGVMRGRGYEKLIKYRLDINIVNRDMTLPDWEEALRQELYEGILEYCRANRQQIQHPRALDSIKGGNTPSAAIMAREAKEMISKYGGADERNKIDKWLEGCSV